MVQNPEIEGQKLIAFIEAAIAEVDERIRREEEEKRLAEERKKAQLEKERKAKEQAERERQMQEQRRQAEEEKRAEAARRAEAERKAKLAREREERRLREERAKQEAEHRRLEEAKRAQAEKAAQSAKAYTWAVPGARVQHKSFGIGIIKAIRGTALDVEFNGELKHFSYPGAFEQKFLTQASGNTEKPKAVESTRSIGFQEKIKQELAGYGIKYTYNSADYGFVEYAVEHLKTVRNVCSKYGAQSFNSFVQGGIMLYRIHFAPGQESAPATQKNDIYKRLVNAGFRCIDNRSTSSILWVLYSVEKKLEFEKIARECNVKYTLERRGSVATKNLAAWRIMC